MHWSIDRKINTGFGVALLMTCIIAIAAYQSTSRLIDGSELVTHSHQVIERLDHLILQVQSAETGQRGYIISGKAEYLEPYNSAIAQIDRDLDSLQALTADNLAQQRRLDQLEPLIAQRLAFAQATIDLRTSQGFEAAAQKVLTNQGNTLTNEVRRLIAEMRNDEHRLLNERDLQARQQAGYALAVILLGGLLAFGTVALASVIIRRDMLARKRDGDRLRESEALFRQLAENIDEIFWMTAPDPDQLIYISPAYERIWGRSRASLYEQPRSFYDAIHPEDRERVVAAQAGKAHGDYNQEYRIVRPDGTIRWLWARTFPIRDAQGEIYRLAGVCQDITIRKQIDQMKNEFISVVSHELRTPLTSIRGSLGLVSGGVVGQVPPQAKAMIDIAYKNSERLVRLINDILDIEKIESGRMIFDMKPLLLVPLLEQVIEANRGYATTSGVQFVLEHSLPDTRVLADNDRLAQVLTNLLSNAVKFSPPNGTVVVSMARRGSSIRVAVADRGPGIPEAFRDRIFHKFAQADSSVTRQKGGTGLGLSITKAIVEKLGGQIGFETALDAGTTFYFDLPEWRENNLPATVTPPAPPRPRILVCEDDRDIAVLLSLILDRGGFATDIAHDAEQAKQLLASQQYAAMTLDIMLPGQDGGSLIRELSEHGHRHLPIVVVSAKVADSRRDVNSNAVTIIDWLDKPIDQERLIMAVKRAARRTANSIPRILHVEDDPDVIRVVAAVLGDLGMMTAARSLVDARQKVEQETFDVIILDVGLPDGSGLELLPLLQDRPSTPVVLFSVHEPDSGIRPHIATTLIKSRTSNQELLDAITALITHDQERAVRQ